MQLINWWSVRWWSDNHLHTTRVTIFIVIVQKLKPNCIKSHWVQRELGGMCPLGDFTVATVMISCAFKRAFVEEQAAPQLGCCFTFLTSDVILVFQNRSSCRCRPRNMKSETSTKLLFMYIGWGSHLFLLKYFRSFLWHWGPGWCY